MVSHKNSCRSFTSPAPSAHTSAGGGGGEVTPKLRARRSLYRARARYETKYSPGIYLWTVANEQEFVVRMMPGTYHTLSLIVISRMPWARELSHNNYCRKASCALHRMSRHSFHEWHSSDGINQIRHFISGREGHPPQASTASTLGFWLNTSWVVCNILAHIYGIRRTIIDKYKYHRY